MRVVYVLSQNSGGLPHYAAELANAVSRHADVVVFKPSETTADDVFESEVKLVNAFESMDLSIPELHKLNINPIKNIRGLLSYRNLRSLQALDPDVIHDPTGFFPQVRAFASLYGLDKQFPLVVTYHEVPPDTFSFSRPISTEELFSAVFYTTINAVLPDIDIRKRIVHSENQRATLIDRGVAPEGTNVIPHGVYEFFKQYDYDERPEEDNCLLFFGNLLPAKGINTLIRSIPLVAQEIPDVKLIVAGNGRLSKQSRLIIADNNEHFEIHDRFIENDRVGSFFSRAQLVVLPYEHRQNETKGHSGVLSTAFSFGKPVVSTTVGGFPELVGNANTGLVVSPGEREALVDAIIELLSNNGLRERFAANSSAQADRLSWKNVAKQHHNVYEAAIASFDH